MCVDHHAHFHTHTHTHYAISRAPAGYDRVARHVLGFHGSLLNNLFPHAQEPLAPMWAPGAWAARPLFAASGLRRVVMQHQHDLEGLAMARDPSYLCFSLATGTHLSGDLGTPEALANLRWTATSKKVTCGGGVCEGGASIFVA